MEVKKVLTIFIIIIFLVIIGILAYLYIIGKENLKENEIETGNIQEEEKLNPVTVQCAFACESGQKTSFCLVERIVTDDLTTTCEELSKNSQYAQYNVQSCPSIACTASIGGTTNQTSTGGTGNQTSTGETGNQTSNGGAPNVNDQTCIIGLGGRWETPIGEQCPQTGEEMVIKLIPSDEPPISGQICCA